MGIFDLFGPPNVEKLLAKKDVDGLIKALRHNEANIRESAAEALGIIGSARAVEPLVAAIGKHEASQQIADTLCLFIEKSGKNIKETSLRQIAALESFSHVVKAHDCNSVDYRISADYSALIQLARQELIRRGLEA